MAENGTLKSNLPLIITIVLAAAPVLVVGGRLVNRVDNLEATVKERGAQLQQDMNQRFDNLTDIYNNRTSMMDRQVSGFDGRLRALEELRTMLAVLQNDFRGMAGTDSRQDEAIKQVLARIDRLLDRLNELEREIRPYQPGGPATRRRDGP